MSYIVSVLTPTYNREKELHNLYKSLKSQTNKEFEWVIVDDGSSDNTEEVVKGWIEEKTLDIKYIKQENGGKHTAVNTGVAQISSPLTFIVDSDDILTADAIDSIIGDSAEVVNNDKLCGIGYLRGFSETDVIGDKFSINRAIGNFNVERVISYDL